MFSRKQKKTTQTLNNCITVSPNQQKTAVNWTWSTLPRPFQKSLKPKYWCVDVFATFKTRGDIRFWFIVILMDYTYWLCCSSVLESPYYAKKYKQFRKPSVLAGWWLNQPIRKNTIHPYENKNYSIWNHHLVLVMSTYFWTRFHQCMIPKLLDHTSPAQKYWDPHDSLHNTNIASNQDGSVAIDPAKPWFKGEKRTREVHLPVVDFWLVGSKSRVYNGIYIYTHKTQFLENSTSDIRLLSSTFGEMFFWLESKVPWEPSKPLHFLGFFLVVS